jgi:hypothetical protein
MEQDQMANKERVRVRVTAGRQGSPIQQIIKAAPKPNLPTTIERQPENVYQAIIQLARDPDVDPVKLKVFIELQITLEDREAQKAFTRAFHALQSELPTINKDGLIDNGEGKNPNDRTPRGHKRMKARFASYPNIMEVCKPLLSKHGFTLSDAIEPSPDLGRIVVVGYLDHVGGHCRISRFPLGIDDTGKKNNQQGWGSAQQYGMRYNAIALLNIVSKAPQDQDNDGYPKEQPDADDPISSGPERVSEEQAMKLREAIEDCGVTMWIFFNKFRVQHAADLPADLFEEAMTACANYKKAKQDGNHQ